MPHAVKVGLTATCGQGSSCSALKARVDFLKTHVSMKYLHVNEYALRLESRVSGSQTCTVTETLSHTHTFRVVAYCGLF